MRDFRGTHRTTIRRDGRGWQWLRPGVSPITPVAVPPVSQYLLIGQQQPDHLQAFVRAGVEPRNTRAPNSDTILLRQEQPFHPLPYLLRGVAIPNINQPGVKTWIFIGQERPFHPLPYVLPFAPTSIIPAVSFDNKIITRQEMPDRALAQPPMLSHFSPLENPWVFGYTVQ